MTFTWDGRAATPSEPESPRSNHEGSSQAPVAPHCPECGAVMLRKTVRSGEHQGTRFWGCSRYPTCAAVLPLEDEAAPLAESSRPADQGGHGTAAAPVLPMAPALPGSGVAPAELPLPPLVDAQSCDTAPLDERADPGQSLPTPPPSVPASPVNTALGHDPRLEQAANGRTPSLPLPPPPVATVAPPDLPPAPTPRAGPSEAPESVSDRLATAQTPASGWGSADEAGTIPVSGQITDDEWAAALARREPAFPETPEPPPGQPHQDAAVVEDGLGGPRRLATVRRPWVTRAAIALAIIAVIAMAVALVLPTIIRLVFPGRL